MTELEEIWSYLNFLVECDWLSLVIDNGLDQVLAVALVQEGFNFIKGWIEDEELVKGFHFQVFEVVLALLENSYW